ncbi:hypothetical protein SDC9_166889 [bioreactor metagenome]|uniref:Uncharacterized protein n=1 Tax=bioreactor metagenome TaxID=1076179 RepID=A0A645FY91_9ZZZZ
MIREYQYINRERRRGNEAGQCVIRQAEDAFLGVWQEPVVRDRQKMTFSFGKQRDFTSVRIVEHHQPGGWGAQLILQRDHLKSK